jgi:5,5'-dehydrodivanillate O-demethylase oxygenase subunit
MIITQIENERLTRVGPGTPAGELLRRYWWPVAFSGEMAGARPKKVKLLGEEFVLFRDGAGKVGMLELYCAHRRISLARGRVEEQGLRCCYHGWLWSTEGKCLEQPCEEPGRSFADRIAIASYPIEEAGGFVFVYIGPKPVPLLPKYDLLHATGGTRYLWAVTNHCNWLQSAENSVDRAHLAWLHAPNYPRYAKKVLKVDWTRRDYGMDFAIVSDGAAGQNRSSFIFPSAMRFASARVEQGPGGRQNLRFGTPMDDTSIVNFFITLAPTADGKPTDVLGTPPDQVERGPYVETQRGVYREVDDGWWNIESNDQDRMATEEQGPLLDRSRENLAASDRGIVLYRTILNNSLDAVAAGRDPLGVIRDPAQHKLIEFGTQQHDAVRALSTAQTAAE